VFYFNPTSGVSMRHHPLDDHWKQLFEECRDASGDLFERNQCLTSQLRQPITTAAHSQPFESLSFAFNACKPLGVGMNPDGSVEYVLQDGQGQQSGVGAGCQILSVDGCDVANAHDYKKALKGIVQRHKDGDGGWGGSDEQWGRNEAAGQEGLWTVWTGVQEAAAATGGDQASGGGLLMVEVSFATPMAAAIERCEREFLCDDDLLARAKLRLAEGPDGPDAAGDPYFDDEEEEGEEGDDGDSDDYDSDGEVEDAPPSRY